MQNNRFLRNDIICSQNKIKIKNLVLLVGSKGKDFCSFYFFDICLRKPVIVSTFLFEMYRCINPLENSIGFLPALGLRNFFLRDL